jgi:hypothetical protein
VIGAARVRVRLGRPGELWAQRNCGVHAATSEPKAAQPAAKVRPAEPLAIRQSNQSRLSRQTANTPGMSPSRQPLQMTGEPDAGTDSPEQPAELAGGTLPRQQLKDLSDCMRTVGDEALCRQKILGEKPNAAGPQTILEKTSLADHPSDNGGFF